ncbi:hypothetical protein [Brevibacterium limosum]|uniref:hypothetical protein n=1 Tax=Brevibacterium limosum TaxID=2697565 RepID=UPI001420244F|nr:hypothetical protein [Brevibacterium limosum]
MEIKTRSIRSLAYRCEEFLDESGQPRSISYPNSLALCILDALFMTGSHPTAIDNVVDRYTARHGGADGAKSLRYSIAAAGGSEKWAREVICNLKPAHTQPGAMLRAEVVDRATRVMADHGIDTVDDLLAAVGDEPSTGRHANEVACAWKELPSQKSGISWRALLMVAGSDHFEIDYRVKGFFGRPFGSFPRMTDDEVLELISATADYLEVDDRVVKQIIWQVSHRRLRPDPKRKEFYLPYPLDDELDEEPDWWLGVYDPEIRNEADEWSSIFEPEFRTASFESEEALESQRAFEPKGEFAPADEEETDWSAPYPLSGTTGAAPF